MNYCSECNAPLIEDAEFCHKCGTKVSASNKKIINNETIDEDKIGKSEVEYGILRCPKCGLINPPKSDNCDCGYSLTISNESLPGNNISQEIKNNSLKKKPNTLIFFGYLFSVLGGYIGIVIALMLLFQKNKYDKKSRKHGIYILIISFFTAIIFEGIRQIN